MKFSNIRFVDINAKEGSNSYSGNYPYNEISLTSVQWEGSNGGNVSVVPSVVAEASHTGNILFTKVEESYSSSYSFLEGEWEYGIIKDNTFVEAKYSNSTSISDMVWRKIYSNDIYYMYKQTNRWYIGTRINNGQDDNNYMCLRLNDVSYVPFNVDNLNKEVEALWYDYWTGFDVRISSKPANVINEEVELNVTSEDNNVNGSYNMVDPSVSALNMVWEKDDLEIAFDNSFGCWVIKQSDGTVLCRANIVYGTGLSPETAMRDIPEYDNFIDDCLYVFKKYPSIASSLSPVSPTNMTQSEEDFWSVTQRDSAGPQYNAFNVFNGNSSDGNGFISNGESIISNENPCWIILRSMSSGICVKSYSIKPLYGSSNVENRNPEKWILQASNDGETWEEIDSRHITWPSSDYGKKVFNTSNNQTYAYYKISVSKTNTENLLSIGLIEFYDNNYYDSDYYTLPVFGSQKSGISKFGFVGCPKPGDRFWDILTEKNKEDLERFGWISSDNKYATIYCSTVNDINFVVGSECEFYTEGIDYLRNNEDTPFNVIDSYSYNNRYMFRFLNNLRVLSIRNCRFSAWGVNIDDDRYLEQNSPMKCCAYIQTKGMIDKLVFEGNIVNYIPETRTNQSAAYDGFSFNGFILGAYISNNKCFMTKSDNNSWINGGSYPRYMFGLYSDSISGIDYNNLKLNFGISYSRFICFNNNELNVRVNNYKNMNGWFYCDSSEKIEFIGNSILEGRSIGNFNKNDMNLFLYGQSLVKIMRLDANSSYTRTNCYDYIIKDFYVDLPSLWAMYNAHVISLNFSAYVNGSPYNGINRYNKKNVIDNITILLGEGPEKSNISQNDVGKINTWINANTRGNTALYINGLHFDHDDSYYYHCNQSNIATNIKVYHPWGVAAFLRNIYAEVSEIRGGITVDSNAYVNIGKMSIKNAREDSIKICGKATKHLEIEELFVEDITLRNYVKIIDSVSGEVLINKTNYPIVSTDSVVSNDTTYRNEFIIVQKNIGDNNGFLLKSTNKFIESCSIKHGSNSTLKMFGMYEHDSSLKVVETGNSGLLERDIDPGKYKLRINMAITGADSSSYLYKNTITDPKDNRKNALLRENITIGIKTKYGELSCPDNICLNREENNGWDTLIVTPFYQEYYVDIYEKQTIYATIERFNIYSEGFNFSSTSEAIYLDPEIEVIKIGEIEYSNSISNGE